MADLYGELVERVLFPAWESGIRRRPTLRILRRLQRSEWSSLDELGAFQLRELRALIAHAHAHVPYYRRIMDEAGVAPVSIRHLDDLGRIPILTRPEQRRAGDDRRSSVPPYPVIEKPTGGTTGEPIVVRYDLLSEYWRQAIKLRGYAWAGYRVGDRTLYYWGMPAKPDNRPLVRLKRELDRALKRDIYIDCAPRGDGHLARVVERIQRARPHALVCYAQAGAELARYINRTGSRTWDRIAVLCGAERVFPNDRLAYERAFGPDVFETYGCREVMLIATECEAHDGLHQSMENLVVEIVVRDGEQERPADPGEVGEVVVTDLHNYGMPFIRYATGDLAVAKPASQTCACGRAHLRLEAVEGRRTETLRDGDGNAVDGMIFNLIVSLVADVVAQFQAVQHPDRSISLKMIPTPGLTEGRIDEVHRALSGYLPGVALTIDLVDDIPLTRSGKRQVVIVEEGA